MGMRGTLSWKVAGIRKSRRCCKFGILKNISRAKIKAQIPNLNKNDEKRTEAKPEDGKINGGLDKMVIFFLFGNRKLEYER
jgi:hypothetical protein